jgi:MoaA/NifB/PqqE/SkfB family radical SAM enzyme
MINRTVLIPTRTYAWRLLFALPHPIFQRYQYPSTIYISLTSRCNLRCFICRREGFQGEDLEFENIHKLEKAIRYASTINLTSWGEVFLYPRFEEVLAYIYSINPNEVISITTNGTRLSHRIARLLSGHLQRLVISLNAATPETYNRDMKYGDFETTLSAIRSFLSGLDKKDWCKLALHFVAHTKNCFEMSDYVVLAKNLGIPAVSFGQYFAGNVEHSRHTLLHVKEEYNAVVERTRALGEKLGVRVFALKFRLSLQKKQSSQKCLAPFRECNISPNGETQVCCFAGDYSAGNLFETSFEEVWFGEAYRKLRKKRYLAACSRCWPLLCLDDYRSHFTEHFKARREFSEIECKFANS